MQSIMSVINDIDVILATTGSFESGLVPKGTEICSNQTICGYFLGMVVEIACLITTASG